MARGDRGRRGGGALVAAALARDGLRACRAADPAGPCLLDHVARPVLYAVAIGLTLGTLLATLLVDVLKDVRHKRRRGYRLVHPRRG